MRRCRTQLLLLPLKRRLIVVVLVIDSTFPQRWEQIQTLLDPLVDGLLPTAHGEELFAHPIGIGIALRDLPFRGFSLAATVRIVRG